MTPFRKSLLAGGALALLLGLAGWSGYGVALYYILGLPLFFGLVLLARILADRREPSFRSFGATFAVLVGLAFLGALAGHEGRRLSCLRTCGACAPLLAALDQYQAEHGRYPSRLEEAPGFPEAARTAGLRVSQGSFSKLGDMYLEGINDCDAMIYLSDADYVCAVPVTRLLPFSFTRFYVYSRASRDPRWRYEKVIWRLTSE